MAVVYQSILLKSKMWKKNMLFVYPKTRQIEERRYRPVLAGDTVNVIVIFIVNKTERVSQ